MDEQMIRQLYVEKTDEEVRLLCSYTTRREGFLDILLSRSVLSSEEVRNVLGKVKTHRGSSMSVGGGEDFFKTNNYISFSTGFVSFKYSDPAIKTRGDYVVGLGILIPLDNILQYPYLSFSHSSNKGEIPLSKLNRENIVAGVHKARRAGELFDDGYGNVFELHLNSELEQNDLLFRRVISYPRLELTDDVVVVIPESERERIEFDVHKKQEEYKQFLDKITGQKPEELQWRTIDGRDLFYCTEMIPFIEKMLEPFISDSLPIVWYKDRNLNIALQRLSISLK